MRKEERRGFSSPDFSAGRQNITQHGRSSRQHDKGIGVRAEGGCARNDCRSLCDDSEYDEGDEPVKLQKYDDVSFEIIARCYAVGKIYMQL